MRNFVIDSMRGLTAAGVVVSAVIHLDMYATGFKTISVIGPLFMLNFVAGLVLGVGLVAWRHWLPVFLSAGFGLVTVVMYWISVIHGLFGVKEVINGWPEITASIAEYAALVFGIAATMMLLPASIARWRHV